jgi:XTP/dITP diphosphohydrolase
VTGPGRLVLLVTTHRVAAGLLSWQAWDALRTADVVLAAADSHPLLPALATADVSTRVVEGTATEQAREALAASAGATAVWLVSPDGDPELMDEVTAQLAGQASGTGAQLPEIELLPGSWDLPGSRLLDVVAVMDRLRSPGGCPWDARQTHASLVEYLVEEAYETVEAIESGDDADLREELGDLLLQVLFHSRIAQERETDPWSVDDVAAGIVDKLISRHPHVFGDVDADTAEQVEANWHTLKQVEKGRESVTDGIPLALPALVLAGKVLARASRADMSVPLPAAAPPPDVADATELGDLLLALVAQARTDGLDAEAALRDAVRRHRAAIRAAEGLPG